MVARRGLVVVGARRGVPALLGPRRPGPPTASLGSGDPTPYFAAAGALPCPGTKEGGGPRGPSQSPAAVDPRSPALARPSTPLGARGRTAQGPWTPRRPRGPGIGRTDATGRLAGTPEQTAIGPRAAGVGGDLKRSGK